MLSLRVLPQRLSLLLHPWVFFSKTDYIYESFSLIQKTAMFNEYTVSYLAFLHSRIHSLILSAPIKYLLGCYSMADNVYLLERS